ncbi:MAG: hypothetical protein JWQ38_162 [Flavipsychrobacter sp.]|nr:hypothetical protein [Flavipsychrobacter sp.]
MPTTELAKILSEVLKYYFRKKLPYVPAYEYTAEELKAAEALFKKWSGRLRLIPVILYFALPVIYGWVFYELYLFFYSQYISSPDLFFPMDWTVFIMPGLFLGIGTTDQVATYFQRILMRGKYDMFVDYANRQEGFDNAGSFRLLTRILLFPFLISYILVMTTVFIVSPKQFTYKDVFDLSYHTYRYSQVKKVTYFRSYTNDKKEREAYPHHKIFFTNGTTFRPDAYFAEDSLAAPFIQVLLNNKVTLDTAETDYN